MFWELWHKAAKGDKDSADELNMLVAKRAGYTARLEQSFPSGVEYWALYKPDGTRVDGWIASYEQDGETLFVKDRPKSFSEGSAWVDCPDFFNSMDATMLLPRNDGCHSVLVAPCPPDKIFRAWFGYRDTRENLPECSGNTAGSVLIGAWWIAFTGEKDHAR